MLRTILWDPRARGGRNRLLMSVCLFDHVHVHQPAKTWALVLTDRQALSRGGQTMAVVLVAVCGRVWNDQWVYEYRCRSVVSSGSSDSAAEYILLSDGSWDLGCCLGKC